jgi:hypothetical protein
MKLPTIFLGLCALACVPATADEQLRSDAAIKANTVGSCMNSGKKQAANEEKTRVFCDCIWNVLADN